MVTRDRLGIAQFFLFKKLTDSLSLLRFLLIMMKEAARYGRAVTADRDGAAWCLVEAGAQKDAGVREQCRGSRPRHDYRGRKESRCHALCCGEVGDIRS